MVLSPPPRPLHQIYCWSSKHCSIGFCHSHILLGKYINPYTQTHNRPRRPFLLPLPLFPARKGGEDLSLARAPVSPLQGEQSDNVNRWSGATLTSDFIVRHPTANYSYQHTTLKTSRHGCFLYTYTYQYTSDSQRSGLFLRVPVLPFLLYTSQTDIQPSFYLFLRLVDCSFLHPNLSDTLSSLPYKGTNGTRPRPRPALLTLPAHSSIPALLLL